MKKTILLLFAICAVWTAEAAKTPKRNVAHKKRTITNGSTINVTTAPYQAFLPLGTTNRGGGAILNSEWILTAAHIAKLNPSNVYVGVSSVNSLTAPVQQRTVLRNIRHPNYNNSDTNPENDLALIRVNQPLSLSTSTNATASSIRLASNANESFYTPASNQLLAVSGYGSSTSNGTLSNDLKRVSVQVFNNTSNTNDANKIDCVGPGTNDACTGDSGGPLVAYGSNNPSSTSPPNGLLVGIVSSALFGSLTTGGACGTGGRYVKVSKYVNWIYEAILEETTPNIVCGSATFTKPDVLVDGMGYYEWGTTTPSLLTLTGNTSPNPVYSSTANASGEGIITLSLYTNATKTVLIETITKKVWVGKPGVTTFVTDGTFSFAFSPPNITICKNRGYCMNVVSQTMLPNDKSIYRYNGLVPGSIVVDNFSWTVAPVGMYRDLSTTTTSPTSIQVTNNKVCFGANTTGTFALTVTANGTGTCGTSGKTIFIQANNCGFRVAPNPAQASLTVIFDNPDIKESIAQQLDLLDEKSSKVMKTMKKADKEDNLLKKDECSVTMDVADLPRGTYYLHLTFGDKRVEKVRIILN